MQTKTISEINEIYDLEIPKIVKNIKQKKAKTVLLQFPDGLKPYSTVIADEIEKRCREKGNDIECLIWLGSCYGACDIPNVERLKPRIGLIIQFGHSKWNYKRKDIKIV